MLNSAKKEKYQTLALAQKKKKKQTQIFSPSLVGVFAYQSAI